MAQTASNAKKPGTQASDDVRNRPWANSIAWSAITMAILLFVAVLVNVLVGRIIHWQIVTGLGVLGFVFLSIGRRYRTI